MIALLHEAVELGVTFFDTAEVTAQMEVQGARYPVKCAKNDRSLIQKHLQVIFYK
ncbi:MAG: hypothetical protein IPJ74_07780 [Saprospiraceae bacterium]|nr:hypothetical protein [Saprospiraceae bacterium]